VNPIRAAHAVSGDPGGNVKTAPCAALIVGDSDCAWLVDVFKQNLNLLTLYQSVDKFTIFTDFTVISLRFIPAFIGGDE